jgi:hypothetical protein
VSVRGNWNNNGGEKDEGRVDNLSVTTSTNDCSISSPGQSWKTTDDPKKQSEEVASTEESDEWEQQSNTPPKDDTTKDDDVDGVLFVTSSSCVSI